MTQPLTEITLPIAQHNDNNKRKSTVEQTFSINEIYAVTSPEGTGGKGALIYIANRKEPLQTAQTYSYKSWQEEIERIDEQTGIRIYIDSFMQLSPRIMVNLLAIQPHHLDRTLNRLCIPPIENNEDNLFVQLDKEQFAKLTEEVSHVNSRPLKFLWSLKFPRLPKESEKKYLSKIENYDYLNKKMEEAYEMILGCLFFFFIIMLINIGLSIAILCIVI